MMFMRKILILCCLVAATVAPAQAKSKKNCSQSVEQSIIHLEVLTEAYEQGELEHEIYMDLVQEIDLEVEQKLTQCRSRQTKMLGVIAEVFGEDSALYDYVSNLSLDYKNAREELLNGTERVD